MRDSKFKPPTLTELVSDLSLRYIERLAVSTAASGMSRMRAPARQELSTLCSVLFTITGDGQWADKERQHRQEVAKETGRTAA